MGRKHAKYHCFLKNDFQVPEFLMCSLKGACCKGLSLLICNVFVVIYDFFAIDWA